MRRILFLLIVTIAVSCGEKPQSVAVIEEPATPDSATDAVVEEKWFGKDSEDDTIIYERDGIMLTEGLVTGTFERIERHDFMYYVIADSAGLLHRFFLNTENQRQMDKYFDGYEPARGHPVTIHWIRGPLALGHEGEMITMYQAKTITE